MSRIIVTKTSTSLGYYFRYGEDGERPFFKFVEIPYWRDQDFGYLIKQVPEYDTIYGKCSIRAMEVREGADITDFLE